MHEFYIIDKFLTKEKNLETQISSAFFRCQLQHLMNYFLCVLGVRGSIYFDIC